MSIRVPYSPLAIEVGSDLFDVSFSQEVGIRGLE